MKYITAQPTRPATLVYAAIAVAALACAALPAHAAGDAAAGKDKAAMCIGCHGIPGYKASFPEVFQVPKISGQGAEYIVASLQAYKKGERKHPTMRSISASLTDQDMADLGAFYQQHGASAVKTVAAAPQPSPAVAELLNKGACASCHGADYNKPTTPAFPKLAGQHADYLYASLRAYAITGNPHIGRANAIMGAQVKPYTRAELRQMAQYLSTLPGDLRTVPQSRFR
jgi:cytochrome c553